MINQHAQPATAAPTAVSIHPDTAVGCVRLIVSDLENERGFYERVIGLQLIGSAGETATLGATASAPLVELVGDPGAPARPRRASGLFHLAILVPSRAELAQSLRRVSDAGWRLSGASDHLVSEALYLDDPEGNGIELYRDRPREEWTYRDGKLAMSTLPLDLEGVVAELPADADDPDEGMPASTRIGHVHLQVGNLEDAERFYHGLLGFDVVVRGYPGALFVSAGAYHHHIGLNTWSSLGGGAPPPGSRGLDRFDVIVPDTDELARLRGRLSAAGLEPQELDGAAIVADPFGNRVRLIARG
ncbi:MAG: VOC family protein [Solirubrobacteraceae bacterium]|nr:MAG: bleomycin resistance protein [Solirubrobacterales bacterium]